MRLGILVLVAALLSSTPAFAQEESARASAEARARLAEATRRFWDAPSLSAFIRVGLEMDDALVTSKQHHAEMTTGRSSRTRNPEFERMKGRLAQGVTVSSFSAQPAADRTNGGAVARAVKASPLPDVRPSFFRTGDILFALPLRPFTVRGSGDVGALVDSLSFSHRTSFALGSLKPDGFAHFGHVGMWDVSGGLVRFERPATIHGVTQDGAPTGFSVTELDISLGSVACTDAGMNVRGRNVNPRWTSAIVAWVGRAPEGRASVAMRDISTRGKYGKRTVQVVDLDADTVPDFVVYAGVEPPVVEVETMWKMLYANVGGAWVPFGFAQETDCT